MAEIMGYHEVEYLDAIVGYEVKETWCGLKDVPILMDLNEANKEHRLFGIEVELEFGTDKVLDNEVDQMEEIDVYSEDYDRTFTIPNPFYNEDVRTLDDFADDFGDSDWRHFESDGSLNRGFEVISEPLTYDMALHYVTMNCITQPWGESLGHHGTNGVHIHVYDNKKLYKTRLAYMMYQMQDRLRALTRHSGYANPYHMSKASFMENLVNRSHEIFNSRTRMLNCVGTSKSENDHVEFRFFRVPDTHKNFSEVMSNYIKFVNQIVDLSHQFKMKDLMKHEFEVDNDFNITMKQVDFTDVDLWEVAKTEHSNDTTPRYNEDFNDTPVEINDDTPVEELLWVDIERLINGYIAGEIVRDDFHGMLIELSNLISDIGIRTLLLEALSNWSNYRISLGDFRRQLTNVRTALRNSIVRPRPTSNPTISELRETIDDMRSRVLNNSLRVESFTQMADSLANGLITHQEYNDFIVDNLPVRQQNES